MNPHAHRALARALVPLVTLGLAVAASAARADPQGAAFAGQWKATWEGPQRNTEARVDIGDGSGSWQGFGRSKDNPCVGLRSPIEMQDSPTDELRFVIRSSQAMAGCPDSRVQVKRVDERTATGTLNSRPLTMTRQ